MPRPAVASEWHPPRGGLWGRARSRRRGSWLGPLLGGSLALVLAIELARFIEAAAAAHLAEGRLQLAQDGRWMLWAPAVLAFGALLVLLHGLRSLGASAPQRAAPRGLRRGEPCRRSYRSPLQPLPAVDQGLAQAWVVLELEPGSSWSVVRSNWRRRLRHWHPDAGGDPQLWHQRLEAYRTLQAAGLRR